MELQRQTSVQVQVHSPLQSELSTKGDLIFPLSIYSKAKVKCTLVQALRLCTDATAHRGIRGIGLPFLDHSTRRGRGVSVTTRPPFTPGKTRYPLYRRLGGLQGRSGQVRKISPPPGFYPRTVQPVASRYTDYATRSTQFTVSPPILYFIQ